MFVLLHCLSVVRKTDSHIVIGTLADQNSVASVATTCTLELDGYKGSKKTASTQVTFTAQPNLLNQMTLANLPSSFSDLTSINVNIVSSTATPALTAALTDK